MSLCNAESLQAGCGVHTYFLSLYVLPALHKERLRDLSLSGQHPVDANRRICMLLAFVCCIAQILTWCSIT